VAKSHLSSVRRSNHNHSGTKDVGQLHYKTLRGVFFTQVAQAERARIPDKDGGLVNPKDRTIHSLVEDALILDGVVQCSVVVLTVVIWGALHGKKGKI
jgi:hypothetical protein